MRIKVSIKGIVMDHQRPLGREKPMQRTLFNELMAWKKQPARKPLLLDGARQTGKTYLLEQLLGKTFANVVRIDFLENPTHKEIFEGALSPNDVLMNIELVTQKKIRSKN